ncbi:hypothetical protein BJ912DRAFT_655948 [Pholiota molesta]|nr:hypothetical protein BJ912DRAFT_655948 [Pholiota molesta]
MSPSHHHRFIPHTSSIAHPISKFLSFIIKYYIFLFGFQGSPHRFETLSPFVPFVYNYVCANSFLSVLSIHTFVRIHLHSPIPMRLDRYRLFIIFLFIHIPSSRASSFFF